jgi:predicted aspartyl protease
MRARVLVCLIVLGTFSHGFIVSASKPAAEVGFTLTESGLIDVRVTINGSGPFRFVLDTGSNRTAISDALASRLSLPRVARTETVTSTGSAMGDVVSLDALSLGSRTSIDILAVVLPAGRIHAAHPGADGIVGQDVLIDAHYTLDYRRKRLTWLGANDDSPAGTRLMLRRVEGRLLVELPQSLGTGHPAVLVPDSGASALALFRIEGRTAVPATALQGPIRTSTVNGEGVAQVAVVPQLRIGRETLWNERAVLIDVTERRVDGLLPLSRFSEVTLNGPRLYLTVQF